MGKFSRLGNALYEGDVSIDFVAKRWLWYSISGVIVALAVFGLWQKGLNLGIEFEGGVEFSVAVPASDATQTTADKLGNVVINTGIDNASSPIVNTGEKAIRIQTEVMTTSETDQVIKALADSAGVSANQISTTEIGASWGEQVAKKALTGLIVFLFLVVLMIWGYFREWKMSIAAMVALIHDLVITVGVYALSGFEVTPATVTGVLTILGFSLYDTVVVFDKVRENTKRLRTGRRTYAELANLAINQTLVRSINTSIVALLPVGALLYVGIFSLGSGALKDLALALFVGMAAGAYSSIFIATPLLAQLKTREKAVSESDARAKARRRRDVDRYAAVPVFTDDMPVRASDADVDSVVERDDEAVYQAPPVVTRRTPEASGSGRTVPAPKAPIEPSGSAKRNQPHRTPRSKRSK